MNIIVRHVDNDTDNIFCVELPTPPAIGSELTYCNNTYHVGSVNYNIKYVPFGGINTVDFVIVLVH